VEEEEVKAAAGATVLVPPWSEILSVVVELKAARMSSSIRRPTPCPCHFLSAHHLTVEERWSNSCSGCGEVGAEGRPEATGEVSAGRRKLRKRRYL